MANGNTAMIGEAGEEAVLPLKRGPDGRLGVQTSGGGGGGTVFNINVTSAGSSGNAAADHAHAVKQANEIERSMRSFVADELRRQARPGGMLGAGNGTLGGIG
jgi:phage-related minor tail protein